MKKILGLLLCGLLMATPLYAGPASWFRKPLLIQEADGTPSSRFRVLEIPNGTLTDHGNGYGEYVAAGGSESTTVSDTTTVDLTLTGDDITADGLYTAGDSLTLTGADFDVDDDFLKLGGDVATAGTYDFGSASVVLEIPNTAGDVAISTAGQIAVDTTQKQLAVYDGVEVVIPLRHQLFAALDLASWQDLDTDVPLLELDATVFPDGIVITEWDLYASVADPTTELDANLMYCDDVGTGAFPGGSATLIDVLDSTTGNSSEATMSNSDLGSGVIPTTKMIYIDLDADPADANTIWFLRIEFYIPES